MQRIRDFIHLYRRDYENWEKTLGKKLGGGGLNSSLLG